MITIAQLLMTAAFSVSQHRIADSGYLAPAATSPIVKSFMVFIFNFNNQTSPY